MLFTKTISAMALLLIGAAFCGPVSGEEELNWAQQLVRPVENTSVHHNETVNYGRYKFAYGPVEKDAINAVTSLEGKTSAILYKATDKNSVFEIFSVYKKFLKDKGFEIVFSCEKEACGPNFSSRWYGLNPFENNPGWNNSAPISGGGSYIAARKKSASGDLYVSVYISSGWWSYPSYRIDVAQVGELETEVAPASRIGKAMSEEGRMAFYGITFDTGKSAIKPESEPTLAEIAAYLKTINGQAFYVVGHTDGEGTLADNIQLAQDRASAVKAALIEKYGVPAAMLSAHGGGPLSPVATNDTAEGRALNRRVEIVKASGRAAAPAAAQPAPQTSSEPPLSAGLKLKDPSPAQTALTAAQAKVAAAKTKAAEADKKKAEAKTMPEKVKAMAEKMKADAELRAATQELAKAQAQVRAEAVPAKN